VTAPAPLAITGWVLDTMHAGGYFALGGLILLENLFPPIPSEIVLPLAGFFVGQGILAFVPAVAVTTLASVVGALILYAAGRYGGRPLLFRWGRVARLDEAKLDRADAWFDRHGPKIVLFGRLVPGVRSIVSVPAGASEMPIGLFVGLTAAGSAVWNAALIGAGWALGSNWHRVGDVIGPVSTVVAVMLAAVAVAGILRLRRRRAAGGRRH
jgi:membrane protein DedA with SNARE-associated domain